MSRALALLLLLAGCAAPARAPGPSGPPIVLTPPARVALPPVAPRAVSAQVKTDSAAVQRRARRWVAPPSTPLAAVAGLAPLTRGVTGALAVMERHRTRRGYRPADVAAARAAVDAVSGFIAAQDPEETPAGELTQ